MKIKFISKNKNITIECSKIHIYSYSDSTYASISLKSKYLFKLFRFFGQRGLALCATGLPDVNLEMRDILIEGFSAYTIEVIVNTNDIKSDDVVKLEGIIR